MQKKLTVLLAATTLALGGCIKPYRPDIQQGNIITQEMVDKLKPGMSQDQVQFIMGTPVLTESFDINRADYVYTFKPGSGNRTTQKKYLTLHFKNGRLTTMDGSLDPNFVPPKKQKSAPPAIKTDTTNLSTKQHPPTSAGPKSGIPTQTRSGI